MGSPRAVLAEDETLLRSELAQHLAELWPELRIVGEATTGIEALDLLDRLSPDVLFLDIEMPLMSGLAVAQRALGRCHIVFVTAYDEHAVAAFEAGAVDYVLKPLERNRLRLAVDRLKQRAGFPPPNLEALLRELTRSAPRQYLRWINASVGQTVRLITVDEILYFRADTKYTRVDRTYEALIRKVAPGAEVRAGALTFTGCGHAEVGSQWTQNNLQSRRIMYDFGPLYEVVPVLVPALVPALGNGRDFRGWSVPVNQ